MPTRAYYRCGPQPNTLRARVVRWARRLRRRNYVGWTVRATTGRDVPVGTVGRVAAVRRQDGDLSYVIDFRPALELHVPLPWPGLELVEPPGREEPCKPLFGAWTPPGP